MRRWVQWAGVWRLMARPIVERTLKQTEGMSEKERRRALQNAYPWGPRSNWPYRVWRSEVRYQQGLDGRIDRPKPRKKKQQPGGQLTLFGEDEGRLPRRLETRKEERE